MKKQLLPILLSLSFMASIVALPAGADHTTPIYTWSEDEQPKSMGSAYEWFCGFKHIQGKFEGEGEGIFLSIDEVNGSAQWAMQGRSETHGLYAEAFCIPASVPPKGYSWAQGQPPVKMGSNQGQVCALTGVGGKFEGEGEMVEVSVDNGQWVLYGKSNQKGVNATAACFKTTAKQSFHRWNEGKPSLVLGSALDRQCFLLSMQGKFEGSGEQVYLFFEQGSWRLYGVSNQHGVSTSAVCID